LGHHVDFVLSHDVQKETLNQILSIMDKVNVEDSCGRELK